MIRHCDKCQRPISYDLSDLIKGIAPAEMQESNLGLYKQGIYRCKDCSK